jgi:hypothetical protein
LSIALEANNDLYIAIFYIVFGQIPHPVLLSVTKDGFMGLSLLLLLLLLLNRSICEESLVRSGFRVIQFL